MENKTYYYARCSSNTQKLDRQLDQFKDLGAEDRDIITDKESGKDFDRDGYKLLKEKLLRNGDTLVVCSIDRLGRNKNLIKEELEYYRKNNIRVKILDIPTTLIDFPQGQEWVCEMVNNILIEVLGCLAERERSNIKEKQKQGIVSAKNRNVKFGRPRVEKPSNYDEVYKDWKDGKISAVKAMELTGLTKTIFYRFANEQK